MQKWKTLSTKIILDHPRLKVLEDSVELPNGKITDYIKFETRGRSATVICKNSEGKFLLQKEYSYPPNEVLFQFPGGFIPMDEDIVIGANRELMEEAKYISNNLILLGEYFDNNRRSGAICYVFLGTELVERSKKEDDEEFLESYWFEEKEIDNLIAEDKIKNISVLAAWSLYKLKK